MSSDLRRGSAVLADGLSLLQSTLGDRFEIIRMGAADRTGLAVTADAAADRVADLTIQLRDTDSGIWIETLVDAVTELSPAQVDRSLRPRATLLRRLQSRAVLLVVAPWLSPRTRELLHQLSISYLDLTGNVWLDISRPRVLIRTSGATKNPWPAVTTGARTLAGPRAGRLVRWLVDRPPPYRVTELAQRVDVSAGYVSRLIDVMADLGLLRRSGKVITAVDWVGLIRERASSTNLLKANHALTMIAPGGAQAALRRLASDDSLREVVRVTGSAAAAVVAPLTVGGPLMLYVPTDLNAPERVADAIGLLHTDDRADALLLRPFDRGVVARPRKVDGLWHVALSQLALDCLSGPDRLPAAGEAVLQHMVDTEDRWRTTD